MKKKRKEKKRKEKKRKEKKRKEKKRKEKKRKEKKRKEKKRKEKKRKEKKRKEKKRKEKKRKEKGEKQKIIKANKNLRFLNQSFQIPTNPSNIRIKTSSQNTQHNGLISFISIPYFRVKLHTSKISIKLIFNTFHGF